MSRQYITASNDLCSKQNVTTHRILEHAHTIHWTTMNRRHEPSGVIRSDRYQAQVKSAESRSNFLEGRTDRCRGVDLVLAICDCAVACW